MDTNQGLEEPAHDIFKGFDHERATTNNLLQKQHIGQNALPCGLTVQHWIWLAITLLRLRGAWLISAPCEHHLWQFHVTSEIFYLSSTHYLAKVSTMACKCKSNQLWPRSTLYETSNPKNPNMINIASVSRHWLPQENDPHKLLM